MPSRFATRKIFKRRSRFDELSDAQCAEIQTWLIVENVSFRQAKERILERFGLTMGEATIFAYYHRVCVPLMMAAKREKSGLSLEISYRVLRGDEEIGKYSTSIPLNKTAVVSAMANSLPPGIQQIIRDSLN